MTNNIINPRNPYDFHISKSKIHDLGLFSSRYFNKGDILGVSLYEPTLSSYVITKLSRYVNHNYDCNTYLLKKNNIYYLVAKCLIQPGDEITADYRYTPDYIKKPNPEW